MNDHAVTIAQVLHPETREVLGFEVIANDGRVYFVERPGGYLEGMRCNPFPNTNIGERINVPMVRVEIARLD